MLIVLGMVIGVGSDVIVGKIFFIYNFYNSLYEDKFVGGIVDYKIYIEDGFELLKIN